MKKQILISGLVLMLVSFLSLGMSVQAGIFHQPEYTQNQSDKVKIKKEDLPEAAQKTLEGEDFKDWAIIAAYKTKEGEYEVELKKEGITKSVKFDKDGKLK